MEIEIKEALDFQGFFFVTYEGFSCGSALWLENTDPERREQELRTKP